MKLKAHAKINWTLDITGRREDGYHLMDMLMQSVTLSDTITLKEADGLALTCGGSPLLPADANHLALRAAVALQQATGCKKGAAIHVEKHIPVGAGMGGGSADAAGVLIGLNRLWGLNLSQAELERIGLTLGADVPFCLCGGLGHTTGIGEKIESLPVGNPVPLCVIQPCEGLSTREVFQAYHAATGLKRPDNAAAAIALTETKPECLNTCGGNVMRQASEARRPEIGEAIHALQELGALFADMTGSGSAVFGAFASREKAIQAGTALQKHWGKCWVCETCTEPVEWLEE